MLHQRYVLATRLVCREWALRTTLVGTAPQHSQHSHPKAFPKAYSLPQFSCQDGSKFPFQTTVKAAGGNILEAERVARLCWEMLHGGKGPLDSKLGSNSTKGTSWWLFINHLLNGMSLQVDIMGL